MLENKGSLGFAIVDLLISLLILGVLVTYSIPKIIVAQQQNSNNAIAKEASSMVSGALQAYKISNTLTDSTGMSELTPYINFVSVDTSTVIDDKQTQTSVTCSATGTSRRCLRLHNGAILRYGVSSSYPFGSGTASNNAIWFDVDPDGQYSGTTDTGKAVEFWLYQTGRLSTYATVSPATCSNGSCTVNPNPAYDPPWFSW